jgi:FtsZ-interacting cell division protein YlmF
MTEQQHKIIKPVLDTIVNEDIRNFAVVLLDDMPDYIWHVGASSTGKYHPAYSLGEGGLMRHQMAVVRFINFFFELEQYNSKLTDREMDLVRVAALMHDGRKSGEQNDYEKSKYTKFDHPLLMKNALEKFKGQHLTEEEIDFIGMCIETHMGGWNTDKKSDVVLPKPSNKYQRMVHVADYLASRKCLTMDFDMPEENSIDNNVSIDTYVLDFGKNKGKTIPQIAEEDISYLYWAEKEMTRQPAAGLIKKYLSERKEN